MTTREINTVLNGIVENYFEGKDLTELMQAAIDDITINNMKKCLSNFKG